jgi:hypothetical protein
MEKPLKLHKSMKYLLVTQPYTKSESLCPWEKSQFQGKGGGEIKKIIIIGNI